MVWSVVEQRPFVMKSPRPERLETLFFALTRGVQASRAEALLARYSGLSAGIVREALDFLRSSDALVTRRKSQDRAEGDSLYDRQIRFLSTFESQGTTGQALNRRLQNRKILVVGVGGVGSWIALLCARIGIKGIVLLDPDRVELSNLSRQILYTNEDIGKPKVKAAVRNLSRVDPSLQVDGHQVAVRSPDDLEPFLDGVSLVFNTFGLLPLDQSHDTPFESVALAALEAKVPSLIMTASWVGPLTVPGKTACYWCAVSDKRINDTILRSPARPGSFQAAFAPRIGITTSVAVWEAARYLSGISRPATMDGIISLDLQHYTKHSLLKLARNVHCRHCGPPVAGIATKRRKSAKVVLT